MGFKPPVWINLKCFNSLKLTTEFACQINKIFITACGTASYAGMVGKILIEKLARIPEIVREAVEAREQTRFDRSHFKSFGDFSLNFETVYYMLVPDYDTHMDVQEEINLELYRRFEEEGIEFAYPTQTLFVDATTRSLSGRE